MKTVKLTKAWKGHAAETVLSVPAEDYDDIIKGEFGADHVEKSAEPEAKSIDDAAVKSIVDAKIEAAKADIQKASRIQIVEDFEKRDPLWGYGGEHSKSIDQLSKHEIHSALGKFAMDVADPSHTAKGLERVKNYTEAQFKAAGSGSVVGDDEHGGYALFPAAAAMVNNVSIEESIVRSRANSVTLGTRVLNIPYARDDNRKNSSGNVMVYQGVVAYWEDELSQLNESRPSMGKIELKLNKLTALGYASGEWIKWSPQTIGSWLIPQQGAALGYTEDYAFINGTGAGQPLGILNSPAKLEIAKESGQDADTFVYENSLNMLARIKRSPGSQFCWLMSQTVLPQLPQMNLAVGTGGSAVFMTNATGPMPMTLHSYPIIVTEKVPTLGDAGDVVLCDMKDYLVANDQGGPEIAESIHLKFDYDQTAFRTIKYTDGQPFRKTVYTPPTVGATAPSTLSPIVTLAARA
jgi:HK97 family phage major capsid protein